jgi:transposase/quinol monooxygenase YgiN
MIIRVFRARLKPDARPAYERLCRTTSLPLMRAQEGCLAVSIGEPSPQRPAEFVVVSVWRDLERLQAFAGERWREATIMPGEADLMEVASVAHYDESYRSLIELWSATADAIKRREATALAIALTDAQWEAIFPLLAPPARTGRPRAHDRRTLEGILYVLRNGCRWHDLPRRYGDPVTCWRRFVRWQATGEWERIWETLLRTMDPLTQQTWALAFLDMRQIPTKPGRKYGAWANHYAPVSDAPSA